MVVFLWDVFFAQSSTLNQKPQLGPQNCHHHDEVRKNVISYAVGLMWSIVYCRSCLVNRKTAMVAKMTLKVGISEKWEKYSYVGSGFLVIRKAAWQHARLRVMVLLCSTKIHISGNSARSTKIRSWVNTEFLMNSYIQWKLYEIANYLAWHNLWRTHTTS